LVDKGRTPADHVADFLAGVFLPLGPILRPDRPAAEALGHLPDPGLAQAIQVEQERRGLAVAFVENDPVETNAVAEGPPQKFDGDLGLGPIASLRRKMRFKLVFQGVFAENVTRRLNVASVDSSNRTSISDEGVPFFEESQGCERRWIVSNGWMAKRF
jgi:hypothetical protein